MRLGSMAGQGDIAVIQSMPDSEYEQFSKLTNEQKLRYLSFRNLHNTSSVEQNIARAKDEKRAQVQQTLNLTNGSVAAYEQAVRDLNNGWGDEETVRYAKADLRKRRSELIKLEKEAESGATGMRVRLALMQVRQLLKAS